MAYFQTDLKTFRVKQINTQEWAFSINSAQQKEEVLYRVYLLHFHTYFKFILIIQLKKVTILGDFRSHRTTEWKYTTDTEGIAFLVCNSSS